MITRLGLFAFVVSVLPTFAGIFVDPILKIPVFTHGDSVTAHDSYHQTFDVFVSSARIVDGTDDYLRIRFDMQGQPDVFTWAPDHMSYETLSGWSSVAVNGRSADAWSGTQRAAEFVIPFKYGEMFSLDIAAEAFVGYSYHSSSPAPSQNGFGGLGVGTAGSGSFVVLSGMYTMKDAGALIQTSPGGLVAAAIPEPSTALGVVPALGLGGLGLWRRRKSS